MTHVGLKLPPVFVVWLTSTLQMEELLRYLQLWRFMQSEQGGSVKSFILSGVFTAQGQFKKSSNQREFVLIPAIRFPPERLKLSLLSLLNSRLEHQLILSSVGLRLDVLAENWEYVQKGYIKKNIFIPRVHKNNNLIWNLRPKGWRDLWAWYSSSLSYLRGYRCSVGIKDPLMNSINK